MQPNFERKGLSKLQFAIVNYQMIYFLSIGMVFNVNAGFSGLVNESADNSEGKNYALFIGDTVVVNEVRFFGIQCTVNFLCN